MTSMVVAGGCYFETCESPAWRAVYGSGGRAAAALASVGPVRLVTYFPKDRLADLYELEVAGIEIVPADSPTALAFAYFHPLSDPAIAPPRANIGRNAPLLAEGEVVLRFGLLEGDVIATGRRVVYDPQTVGGFEPFEANGSRADALAVVANEAELRAATGTSDIADAAETLLTSGHAAVVIAKGGVHGATVYSLGAPPASVSAYWSDRVFKIGTGDVFSAAFAHYWGRLEMDGPSAADLASRSVAAYSGGGGLRLPDAADLAGFGPVTARRGGRVRLVGSTRHLSDRWLFEEAAWRLRDLGLMVETQANGDDSSGQARATLALADQLPPEQLAELESTSGDKLVLFSETGLSSGRGRTTRDFATALYWVGWLS